MTIWPRRFSSETKSEDDGVAALRRGRAMKSQPKSARPHRGDPIFGRLRRCFSLTMRRHCIARRASQPSQTWGLQMVTLFLSGP